MRKIGSILSSQALLAFKSSTSFQSPIPQLFNASNTNFTNALVLLHLLLSNNDSDKKALNRSSNGTVLEWAFALQRECMTLRNFKDACTISTKISDLYFASIDRVEPSNENAIRCLNEW